MALIDTISTEQTERAQPRLTLGVMGLYGVGEVANSVKLVLFGTFAFFFYTSVMGLPGTLVGLASGLGLIWDAVVDPSIGHASDRARPRLGRRHAFMLAGSLVVGLAFWALFSPPRGAPTAALFAWFLVVSLLARSANSVFAVPYHALGAELSSGYHERTVLTAIRGGCGLLGALAAASLSFVVFFPNVVPGVDPKLSYAGYPRMGLTLGLTMTLAGVVATLATLPWRSRGAGDTPPAARSRAGLLAGFAVALRNASFRALFLSFTLVFLGTVVNSSLSLYFLTYYARIVDSQALSALQVAFFTGALVGVPVWLRASRRAEKRRLYLIATLATALLMLAAFVLVGEGRPFGTGDARPLLVGQAIAGLAASLFWILPASMLADVADEDALATGAHRAGIFFGIFSSGQQLATGLSVLLAGVLIDGFAGLVPGQAEQSGLTAERLAMLFSLLPAGLLLAGALVIGRYALDRRRVGAIQGELARRRVRE